ncbi:hypothetical protein quinque_012053 [Culex quinquefasciatus]
MQSTIDCHVGVDCSYEAHVKNRQRKTSESSFFFYSNRTMKSLPVFCWWRRARLQRSRLNLTMSSGAGAGA